MVTREENHRLANDSRITRHIAVGFTDDMDQIIALDAMPAHVAEITRSQNVFQFVMRGMPMDFETMAVFADSEHIIGLGLRLLFSGVGSTSADSSFCLFAIFSSFLMLQIKNASDTKTS